MNYEEKYKQALLRAKEFMTNKGVAPNADAFKTAKELTETIFPELRESEDERIRKEMIDFIQETIENVGESPNIWTMNNAKKWLSWLEKQGEQKPEENKGNIGGISPNWSEEDEKFINYAISLTDDAQIKDFLKSLKYRVQPQPKQQWSEEDKKMIDTIIETIKMSIEDCDVDDVGTKARFSLEKERDWLKSLKDRVQPQPKQEWSKEDEYQINTILHGLDLKRELYKKEGNQVEEKRYKTQYDWLKSLKPNHWKPSEEQMEALNAINNVGELSYVEQADLLIKLYNDLEKL